MNDQIPRLSKRTGGIAVTTGVLTGAAAGLVGVGGGEFRIPALIQALKLPIRQAATINLVIGFCTVVVSLARRAGSLVWTEEIVTLGLTMSVASIAGAIAGCVWRSRIDARLLKSCVTTYLVIVGVWMIYESLTQTEHVLLSPTGAERIILGIVAAFIIASISGVLGVAGGEMRIPTLLYLFALPLRDAGTLSLLVSIPTVAAGAVTDRRSGQMPNAALLLALVIGAASIVGVLLGAAWLPHINSHALKGIFGAILLLATLRLMVPARASGL
jgi:uncharacterized membrane protein YfcA